MPSLYFLNGDATNPIVKPAIIVHICNNVGGWGAGFVLALSKKSKIPEIEYRNWFKQNQVGTKKFQLGEVLITGFVDEISVANMIAQNSIISLNKSSNTLVDYDALKCCLSQVYNKIKNNNRMTVHMPRIGCSLGGGSWSLVEPIIKETMTVDTYVYTFGEFNE
jgi:O-acetyl-ADP-ribose deacetylase (regulator of RNase III)